MNALPTHPLPILCEVLLHRPLTLGTLEARQVEVLVLNGHELLSGTDGLVAAAADSLLGALETTSMVMLPLGNHRFALEVLIAHNAHSCGNAPLADSLVLLVQVNQPVVQLNTTPVACEAGLVKLFFVPRDGQSLDDFMTHAARRQVELVRCLNTLATHALVIIEADRASDLSVAPLALQAFGVESLPLGFHKLSVDDLLTFHTQLRSHGPLRWMFAVLTKKI
mmetsp:Transcript_1512/g.4145  ORF Transcript_1512/g.4145 Transcript_1512/m.4145 type:complete len:223 (+) Transcript_1512:1250-1918(+)